MLWLDAVDGPAERIFRRPALKQHRVRCGGRITLLLPLEQDQLAEQSIRCPWSSGSLSTKGCTSLHCAMAQQNPVTAMMKYAPATVVTNLFINFRRLVSLQKHLPARRHSTRKHILTDPPHFDHSQTFYRQANNLLSVLYSLDDSTHPTHALHDPAATGNILLRSLPQCRSGRCSIPVQSPVSPRAILRLHTRFSNEERETD